MRNSSHLMAVGLIALLLLAPPALADETVRFSFQAPAKVTLGEKFRLDLKIDSAGQVVTQLPFIVGYDPAILKAVAVEAGPFFGRDIAQADFSSEIDPAEGRVRVTVVQPQGAKSVSPEILATVVFEVTRRFASTQVQGLTMAPITPDGEGLPPEYPKTIRLDYRAH